MPAVGVTAVAVNITSVDSVATHYVQALPTLQATVGATSTLNVSVLGAPRPNFAIVPVGVGGQISAVHARRRQRRRRPARLVRPVGGRGGRGRTVRRHPAGAVDGLAPGRGSCRPASPRHASFGPGESVVAARLPGTAVPAAGRRARWSSTSPPTTPTRPASCAPSPPAPRASARAPSTTCRTSRRRTRRSSPSARTARSACSRTRPSARDRRRRRLHHRRRRPGVVEPACSSPPARTASTTAAGAPGPFATGRDPPDRAHRRRRPGRRRRGVDQPDRGPGRRHRLRQGVPVGHPADVARRTSTTTPTRPSPTPDLLRLGAGGAVAVFVNQQTHVIIDVNGYFTGP